MVVSAEGKGENQRSHKNKEREMCENQPSHTVSSQKGTNVDKDIRSFLLSTSQKLR